MGIIKDSWKSEINVTIGKIVTLKNEFQLVYNHLIQL